MSNTCEGEQLTAEERADALAAVRWCRDYLRGREPRPLAPGELEAAVAANPGNLDVRRLQHGMDVLEALLSHLTAAEDRPDRGWVRRCQRCSRTVTRQEWEQSHGCPSCGHDRWFGLYDGPDLATIDEGATTASLRAACEDLRRRGEAPSFKSIASIDPHAKVRTDLEDPTAILDAHGGPLAEQVAGQRLARSQHILRAGDAAYAITLGRSNDEEAATLARMAAEADAAQDWDQEHPREPRLS